MNESLLLQQSRAKRDRRAVGARRRALVAAEHSPATGSVECTKKPTNEGPRFPTRERGIQAS